MFKKENKKRKKKVFNLLFLVTFDYTTDTPVNYKQNTLL